MNGQSKGTIGVLCDLAREGIKGAATRLDTDGHVLVLARLFALPADLPEPLSDEITGAARFPDGITGPRAAGYLARRRIARAIFACQSGQEARALRISADARGAPFVMGLPNHSRVSFAARGELAVIGLAKSAIGVDIEAELSQEAIPWKLLRPEEAAKIRAEPVAGREQSFRKLWGLKEAYLKAIGMGFLIAPEEVHVSTYLDGKIKVSHSKNLPNTTENGLFFWSDYEGEARAGFKSNCKYGIALALLPH